MAAKGSGAAGVSHIGNWRREHVIVGLCAVCAFISYADRVNLSVAVIPMAEQLGWNLSEKAAVLAAFFYGYVCSQVFGAYLSVRFGPKPVLGLAVFLWSVVTIITPAMAAQSAHTLAATRVALGLLEGVTYPVMFHLFADHVSITERSWAIAVINMGNGLGAMTAFAVSPLFIAWWGWPSVFHVFGALGIVWSLIWACVVDAKPAVTAASQALPEVGKGFFLIARTRICLHHKAFFLPSCMRTRRDMYAPIRSTHMPARIGTVRARYVM